MLIGFDGSRAFVSQRTGTENYSYNLLCELLQTDRKNAYKIYLRLPVEIERTSSEIKKWVESVTTALPKTNNYRLVLIKNKRLWTQMGLGWEISRRPVDLLFVPAHTLPYFRPKKIKTVVTIHDLGYEYLPQYHKFPDRLWLNKSTEYAAKNADKLIAVSEATRDDLVLKLKANPEKITVVYEGFVENRIKSLIDLKNISEIVEKYGLPKNYLFFVGTIQPRKNLIRIFQAFAEVLKDPKIEEKYPNLMFVLAGKNGWLFKEILEEPERLGISKKVKFLGHIPDEDMYPLMSKSLALVYPSLFEGFGLPILEAQACNIPVITSNKKPMTEVGGAGCEYVDETSVDSIREGLKHVLLDDMYAKKLKQLGSTNGKRFSWKKAASDTLKVLEGV